MGIIGTALRWVLVLVVVAVIGAYLVLATPIFAGFRQSMAEYLIADVLGRTAIVDGSVSVAFEEHLVVTVEGVKLPPDDDVVTTLPDQFVEKIGFALPYAGVFSGAANVSKFHISGVRIDLGDIVGEGDAEATQQSEAGFGVLVSRVLNRRVSDDLYISNVLIKYQDSANGWDEELLFEEIDARLSNDRQFIEIDAAAEVNGAKYTTTGRIQSVRYDPAQEDLPFVFDASIAGAGSRIEGTLNVAGEAATMNADYRVDIESIGQLLDDLGLERTVDGKAVIGAKLQGSLDELRATAITMAATTNRGDTLKVTGEIADLSSGKGIALDFSVDFSEEETSRKTSDILDLQISGYRGHLEGALGQLSLSETVIRTNLANVELEEIGPISIGRVVKDEENRLGLQDITILDGPPERPTLQMEGYVDDLLGFTSVRLEGLIDAPVHVLLGASPEKDTGQLGRVSGNVIVTDKGESVGIDKLDLTVVDTDVWSLTLTFVLGELRQLNDILLDTDLAIPDIKAFAAAIGETVEVSGPITYAGNLLVRDRALELRGKAKVIKTEISGELAVGSVDGKEQITGKLQSDLVRLSDLAVPIDLFEVKVPENVDLEISEDIQESLRVALDLDFAKITGEKKATGKLVGHFQYEDQIASLSDFTLGYLGGVISGNISGNFQKDTSAYSAKVRVKKWRMGRLLGELGLRAPITGTVYVNTDIQVWGESPKSWIKTMSGKLTMSLWGGRVPGRILDLTGLNLVSWLAAKDSKSDSTKLVCVVVPVRLKKGVANGRSMIIETENVQIAGGGTINFRNGGLKLAFTPRAKKQQLIEIVTPFRITGTFNNPKVHLEGGKGGRAFAEVVALPFNLFGQIFTGNKPKSKKEKPCVLPKNTRPK